MNILPRREWIHLLVSCSICGLVWGQALDNHFTYQGQIKQNGTSFTGNCALSFTLWTSDIGGSSVGSPVNVSSVPVANGLFTVHLDMGNVFNGQKRWLQIQAACPSGAVLTLLSPHQELTAASHAAYALQAGNATTATSMPWSGLTGVPSGFADGVDNDTTYSAGAGLTLSGNVFSLTTPIANSATTATLANTAGAIVARDGSGNFSAGTITATLAGTATSATNVVNATTASTATNFSGSLSGDVTGTQGTTSVMGLRGRPISSTLPAIIGQVLKWNGTQWEPGVDDNATNFWSLVGNASTTAGVHFLGTTDNQALELKVDNVRALRLEPNPQSPNIIGGSSSNSIISGVIGGTISGGGTASFGGTALPNMVTDNYGTVGGGMGNRAGNNAGYTDDMEYATVGGGRSNTASGQYSMVAGGAGNEASGAFSIIPGGYGNAAQGNYSFAAGRRAKAHSQGSFIWSDSTDADFGTLTNDSWCVRASGLVAFYTNNG